MSARTSNRAARPNAGNSPPREGYTAHDHTGRAALTGRLQAIGSPSVRVDSCALASGNAYWTRGEATRRRKGHRRPDKPAGR